ncbi:Protein translation factor sui1 [Penicillium subrubescens]|uniref:Protein translation factor sui1 n=1 Tax=Penicillium subrubescens TaxID=1316194 RepID=A0A1Q5UGA9_9EURO|nr:Protein translation factor sui1 [Penicillium subrubescens]
MASNKDMRRADLGEVSFVFSLQTWLAESSEQKKTAATPAYMSVFMSYPFAEADEDAGETKQSQNYIHIRIQQRNGRKTLTTVQGLPKKFDQKKILKVIKKKFACNGTIVADTEMGEVIQLQGDQRKDVQEFLTDKKEGLELDAKTIKRNLRNPKPPLNIPLLSHTPNNGRRPSLPSHPRPDMQQLSQKGKRTSQPPPRRRQRAQRPAYQQRDVPPAVNTQDDRYSRMQR